MSAALNTSEKHVQFSVMLLKLMLYMWLSNLFVLKLYDENLEGKSGLIAVLLIFFPRWSGCVITVENSRRSWPSQVSGSLVRLGNPLASVQPSASRLCAKRPVTRSSGLAPKRPRALSPQSKTPTNPAHPGLYLATTLGHVANHHETRKLKQFHRTCAMRQSKGSIFGRRNICFTSVVQKPFCNLYVFSNIWHAITCTLLLVFLFQQNKDNITENFLYFLNLCYPCNWRHIQMGDKLKEKPTCVTGTLMEGGRSS